LYFETFVNYLGPPPLCPYRATMSDGKGIGQVIVLSGGSGYNNLVGATPSAIYVMPGT